MPYNPFLPLDEYIPDGEPHVFGDRVYLFGSHDKEGGDTFCMLDYVVYSAPVDHPERWRREGVIYRAAQDPMYSERYCNMYAPDVVRGNDGKYYLYYALAGPEVFTSTIHVAVCDTPAGQYKYHGCVSNPDGTPFTRCITFDPAVINDDGMIRLYYGWSLATDREELDGGSLPPEMQEKLIHIQTRMFQKTREEIQREPNGIMGANVVTLDSDMLTVRSEPARIVPGQFDAKGTSFQGHAFFEASSIRKIGDTYYFIYSSQRSHDLCYATSRYPDKEFVYGGIIVSNGDVGFQGRTDRDRLNATGNNHGSIEKIGSQWYIFYHRHTHNTCFSRQACVERIEIKEDGSIPQVEITSMGFAEKPLDAVGTYPAVICCNLTNGEMPHINGKGETEIPHITAKDGKRFITGITTQTRIAYKYFQFRGETVCRLKIRGEGQGRLLLRAGDAAPAEIVCTPASRDQWEEITGRFRCSGPAVLELEYQGDGKIDLLELAFESL